MDILKLKRAHHRNKTFGLAPHKPVLLLAVIEQIEEGRITENKIFINPELIATFQKLWLKLVPHGTWQPRFFLPFFHLTGDKFWHLVTSDGAEAILTRSYSPKSLAALKDSVQHAYFDPDVWQLLVIPEERQKMKHLLLATYFPEKSYTHEVLQNETRKYVKQLEADFLSGAVRETHKYLRIIEYEARSTVFKSEVPKIYNYTCAISGLRVTAGSGVQLIDACHIRPWSRSKNDTIQNGISLTPTLHRAFDRHLISIDEDYRVIISPAFVENTSSPYNLRQFAGRPILLPEKEAWYPSQEALAEHRIGVIY